MTNFDTTLEARYTLETRLPTPVGGHELWIGADHYSAPVLIKRWSFAGTHPDEGERALWDFELRNLFRLTNLPESEHNLITLKDTGIDGSTRHFVMVFNIAGAVTTLETLLANRGSYPWLYSLSDRASRVESWRGMKRIALGLVQLHEQHIIHRAISASTVYAERSGGADTLRLGGFEWSIRVGTPFSQAIPYPSTLTPPEYSYGSSPFSFDSDWFLIGALFARVIAAANPDNDADVKKQHATVLSTVENSPALTARERNFILSLLAENPDERLSHGELILQKLDEILTSLESPLLINENSHLGVVALLGPGRPLTMSIQEEEASVRAVQTDEQRRFIENDLVHARVVRFGRPPRNRYMLAGNRLCYEIEEYATEANGRPGTWKMAFIKGITELRHSNSSEDQCELKELRIAVFELREVRRPRWVPSGDMIAWERFLPKPQQSIVDYSGRRLHDFFRVTNQIDLLMRDSEIFAYQILERNIEDGITENIIIEETSRVREPSVYAHRQRDLYEYARAQMQEKDTGELFYLGSDDNLNLGRIPRQWFWSAQLLSERRLKLTRPASIDGNPVPEEGFIRPFEQFGQAALMTRRNRAIQRLQRHGYLLRALRSPEHVYIDNEVNELPAAVDPSLDRSKVRALKQIWRSRPIFVLQGPPGTGKTTLVSHLLKQIFEDDPVAQVLISAQAHAAVDVLRDKVSRDIFPEGAKGTSPIQIRLSTPFDRGVEAIDRDHVERVTDRILAQCEYKLRELANPNDIQRAWLGSVTKMRAALRIRAKEDGAPDMCELVKRSANILFCTTTARDLAELATTAQQFDWSIIEEAGKAHGFDLVLPLQTGHRWLMIGDHAQLPPYRYNDFTRALSDLDKVVEDIRKLPRRGGLVDVEFLNRWQAMDEEDRKEHRNHFGQWLATFERMHEVCSDVIADGEAESDEQHVRPLTAMLSRQHRMHPTIAELVSKAYYRDSIVSETMDGAGKPLARVVHPFLEPRGIEHAQIVWVDVPWRRHGRGGKRLQGYEVAEEEARATEAFLTSLSSRQRLEEETLSLAVLSPYRMQTQLLGETLDGIRLETFPWLADERSGRSVVHTVDSFQGNQADVVIVSLVRNNNLPIGKGLGFLDESQRMNVLFSRAERLLVLVGSWEFFVHQMSDTDPDPDHYLGHWRIALQYLDECIQCGKAIKVSNASVGRAKQ